MQGILNGRAIMFGFEDPGTQSRRRIYVGSLREECEVCEGWLKWKRAVPRYRPDGTLYYIDHDPRGRMPTGSLPPGMSGSRAMSEVQPPTSMAPTPQDFTAPPSITANPTGILNLYSGTKSTTRNGLGGTGCKTGPSERKKNTAKKQVSRSRERGQSP